MGEAEPAEPAQAWVLDLGPVCRCPADFNRDLAVDSRDFFGFMGAFFDQALVADFNGDGFINSQDFFDFITAFFTPCP